MMTMLIFSLFISPILFLFVCYLSASDAQGAIVFIFFLPLIWIFTFAGYWLARNWRHQRLKFLFLGQFAFVLLFFISALVPATRFFSTAIIGGVANVFKMVTGETPYERSRRLNDVKAMIDEVVTALPSPDSVLDLSLLDPALSWERLCVFGPYTNRKEALKVLGLGTKEWDLSLYSKVGTSDSVSALVFLNGSSVSYVVDYPRDSYDFSPFSLQCRTKNEVVFSRKDPK